MGRCDKLQVGGHESRAIHIPGGLVWDFWGLCHCFLYTVPRVTPSSLRTVQRNRNFLGSKACHPVVKRLMEPQGVRWKVRAMLPISQDLVR